MFGVIECVFVLRIPLDFPDILYEVLTAFVKKRV